MRRPRPPSMTRRLGLHLFAGFFVLWAGALVAGALVARHEIDEVFDAELQEMAQRLLPLAIREIAFAEDDDHVVAPGGIAPHEEHLVYWLRDSGGRVVLRSHDAPERDRPGAIAAPGFSERAGWRIYAEPSADGRFVIEVAESLSRRREALGETVLPLVVPVALVLPFSFLLILGATRRGLAPARRLGRAIEARDGGNLADLDLSELPVEIAPVGRAVNRLLARLRAALEVERSLAANAAHELRTPVAGALAQAQRLVAELGDGPQASRARGLEAALRRLAALATKLLELARAEAGIAAAAEAHDLVPLVRLVADEQGREAGSGPPVRVAIPPDASFRARIDPDAFAIALRNLVENARRYGEGGGPVEIRAIAGGIAVANGGPVVPPDQLALLRRRFARGSRLAGGAGLGLAIVETIVEQAGGTLDLRSPATGRPDGFEATIRLPEA